MPYAVSKNTVAEIIYNRVDSNKNNIELIILREKYPLNLKQR